MKGQGADLAGLAKRMDGALDVLRKELQGLRTGRASANLLEPITVEAYGSEVPLTQVATVNVPEPRMLTVQVWDRSMVKAVEKAIRSSNLGLNPATDGQLLRVPLPELSQERRQGLVKVAHRYGEQARVASVLDDLAERGVLVAHQAPQVRADLLRQHLGLGPRGAVG